MLAHHVESKTETVTDRAANDTVYYYNERGNVTDVLRYEGTGQTRILRSTTKYKYTGTGKHIDKPTKVSQLVGWNNGQAVYATTETSFGRETVYPPKGGSVELDTETVVDPVGNKTVNYTDGYGRLVKSTQYKPTADGKDYVELASTWNTYDNDSGLLLVTETTTGSGGSLVRLSFTANIYGERNRLMHTVQVDTKNVTEFSAYYILDGLVNSTGHHGIPATDRQYCVVTSYLYDSTKSGSADQPYAVTDPYCPGNTNTLVDAFTTNDVVKRYSAYDSEGRQVESWYEWFIDSTHKQQIVSETDYDKQGRVTSTERKIVPYLKTDETWGQNGNIQTTPLSTTEYNAIGKPKKTTDENGIATKYWYDETGNLVETEVFADSACTQLLSTTQTLFDADGCAIVTVGPYASGDTPVGTETVYDALGRVSQTNRWANVSITVDNVYKPDTNIIVGKKATGWTKGNLLSSTSTEYDAAGRVYRSYAQTQSQTENGTCTQEIHYDAAGRQVEVISLPNGGDLRGVTETHYDGPRQDWTQDARGNVTGFEYNDLGRVVKTIHPATAYKVAGTGNTIQSASGPVYSHVGYDGFGRKAYETPPVGSAAYGGADKYKIFSYDAAGRLTMVMMPEVKDLDSQMRHPLYRYIYDVYGNQVGVLDPLGRVTAFENNAQNQQTKRYMPFVVANPSAIVDAEDVQQAVSAASPAPKYETTTYDPQGRVVKRVDYKQQATLYYYYDAANFMAGGIFKGRPGQLRYEDSYSTDPWPNTSQDMPNPDTATPTTRLAIEYDRLGRKVKETMTPGTGLEYGTSYDNEGRIAAVSSPEGVVHYEYDSRTGLKTATWTGANINTATTKTDYTYDDLGRLLTAQVARRNGQPVTEAATTYAYNDNGSRGSVLLPNGVYTQYQYNAMNRLTEVVNFQTQPTVNNPNPTQLSRFGYGHYSDGQRAAAAEKQKKTGTNTTVVENSLTFRYDGLNRLTEEKGVGPYDAQTETSYDYTASYTFDLVGNRMERQVLVHNYSNSRRLTTSYTYYEGTDRLKWEENSAGLAALPLNHYPVYARAGTDASGGAIYKLEYRPIPSRMWQWGFWASFLVIPILMVWPKILNHARQWRGIARGEGLSLGLYHRCMCGLLAYVMLLSPCCLKAMAQEAVLYRDLSTATWGADAAAFTYVYDANGSLVYKILSKVLNPPTWPAVPSQSHDTYEYDLRGQLSAFTPNGGQRIEYKYNPAGIRVSQKVGTTETKYLIDPYNPTGYAQVLEEWTGGSTPAVTYTIGDDVIGQSAGSTVSYLLYDGHGSTRQLSGSTAGVSDNFSYDGYGVMLGSSTVPNPAQTAATKYLYAGEQYDKSLGHYYLRARYYNPSNGRFNQTDPFAGNPSDPQSLHKYLYAHCNPINNVDPAGRYSFPEMLTVSTIMGGIMATFATGLNLWHGKSLVASYYEGVRWFWITFAATAVLYGVMWTAELMWLWVSGAGTGAYGGLKYAEEYGVSSHNVLRSLIEGTRLAAYHIIPQRFANLLGLDPDDMLCVALNSSEHTIFTNAWQNAIPYRTNANIPYTITAEEIWMYAQRIYEKYPILLEAARVQLLNAGAQIP